MSPEPQNQTVPSPQTMQILVLLKATGDLTGVTPQDLAAYAHAWLLYADGAEDLSEEADLALDHADLDLVGLTGAEAAPERIALALELLEGIGSKDINAESMRWLEGSRVALRCIKRAFESLAPEARP